MGHLVHRQILELTFTSREEARRWSPQLSELNQRIILPELEQVFSQRTGDEALRIERLEIDLGTLPVADLESEIGSRLRQRLTEALQPYLAEQSPVAVANESALPATNRTVQTELGFLDTDSLQELFTTFLQSGQLPWWLGRELTNQLDNLYRRFWQIAPERARQLILQVLADPPQRRRFVEQLSNRSQALTLCQLLAEPHARLLQDLRKLASVLLFRQFSQVQARTLSYEALYELVARYLRTPDLRPAVLACQFFTILAESTGISHIALIDSLDAEIARWKISAPTKGVLAQLLRDVEQVADRSIPPAGMRPPAPSLRREGSGVHNAAEKQESCTLEIPIDNAGLVLLWPHLDEILRKLKLLERLDDLCERPALPAVLLLQQLVTGQPAAQEHLLALNKLLCGVAPNVPVSRRRQRSKIWDAEVDALLTTLIKQWSALKNTSISGFRSSFLQREGILREEEFGWRLQVERKAHDVLLEHLPWGIAMIQFSWMRVPLRVEW